MLSRRNRTASLAVILLSMLFINAGVSTPSPTYTSPLNPPPLPAIMRDVSLVEDGSYMYPYIPSFRTSADGRVAVSVRELDKVGNGAGWVSFYSFVPEALNQAGQPPFRLSGGGTTPKIFPSTTDVMQIADSSLGMMNGYSAQHHTICDPTVQDVNNPPAAPNPSVCGSDDCYTFYVISPTTNGLGTFLILNSALVKVEVTSPKLQGAHITSVTVLSTKNGPAIPISNDPSEANLLEPMITTDGHLLVGRLQGSAFTWASSTNPRVTGRYNIVYSVGSLTANPAPAPCDVNQWSSFYPIAHAYYDSNMTTNSRYGLADYQIRDAENNPIAETADIEGTYPWIDRMGRNLFFTQISATLFNSDPNNTSTGVTARYTDSCAPGTTCTDPCTIISSTCSTTQPLNSVEESDNTRGLTVAGRWTHGKMVQLDGLMNNIDYGLHVPDPAQRVLNLYKTGPQPQFGSGRFNAGDGNPPDYAENTTITDSFENIFNYVAALRPITLREVTWQINMGKGGDEIPFDDYVNPQAFIVSEMTASTSWTQYAYPSSENSYHSLSLANPATYNDGFNAGFNSPIHLQNAATSVSTQWSIPAYGLVQGSGTPVTARVEPAALGGIKGKGFWLQDGNYVSYSYPASQPQTVETTPWFVSLFVDNRCCTVNDSMARRILTFPDGSYVDIVGENSQLKIGYLVSGSPAQTTMSLANLNLPTTQGWWHLGLQVVPNTQNGGQTDTVGIYVNGYLLKMISPTAAPIFQIVPPSGSNIVCATAGCQVTLGGEDNLGQSSSAFMGWVDEFKVIAQNVDYETACNHAHGTIVGDNSQWGYPTGYPQTGATSETTLLTNFITTQNTTYTTTYPKFTYYGCVVDYTLDASATYMPVYGITTGNLPSGSTAMRDYLHFPEGDNAQLVWDKNRPDSRGNTFCTSCHTDGGGQASSTLSKTFALSEGAVQMYMDPRRQPMNPQRIVYGNIPSGYFNGNSPAETAPFSFDQLVFPDLPRNPPNP
jgi:hypothetical protein